VGNEAAKQEPNKTMLRMLRDRLLAMLKAAPDVAAAVTALMPLLGKLINC
jgi:hypothetical protein